MKKIMVRFLLVVIISLIASQAIFAIPSFARKYNMSCQTCHSPFPKLKPYGEEFAGNGFTIADKDAPRYFLDSGDDQLSLLRELPLALRLEGFVTFNNKNSERLDFSAPYNLKLLSGGAIANNISYYFYFFFSERGEVAGIEDAFVMFNNLFDTDLDLYVGQFQVSDPLFKRELRLTFEDYQLYKSKPGYAKADLTYDRGLMLTYGLPTGTDFTLQVLNGTGIGAANDFKIFDDDKYKNFLGRISQDVTEGIRVGAFGYIGKEELEDISITVFTNSFTMFGPDATLKLQDKLELNFQYGIRTDEKHSLFAKETKTTGGFTELIYTPQGDESKWYAVGLYNWVDSDFNALDYESATLGLGYMLRRNIRLAGEFTYNIHKEFGQFSVGLITAF